MACTVYRGSQLNDRLALTSASHHSYSISPCNLTLFCTVQSSSENNLDSPQPVGTPSPILLPTSPLMTVHSATAVQPYREFHYFPPTTRLHPGVSKLPCWICFPKKKRSFMRHPDSTDSRLWHRPNPAYWFAVITEAVLHTQSSFPFVDPHRSSPSSHPFMHYIARLFPNCETMPLLLLALTVPCNGLARIILCPIATGRKWLG